ncbi:MAG TPA: SdrD B-like domain-containing protein, partial [Gemmataceae bacterium]|nr:SdrD B-like domain-containing protein [Gemmataceae bacterium]
QHFDPNSGQTITEVMRGTGFSLSLFIDGNKNLFYMPTITWTDLTANLPPTAVPVERPTDLALDTKDNVLYAGTGNGVWKLSDPANTGNPTWTEVGLNSSGKPSMPDLVPVSAISLNTTTGILAAATYGRGVYEIQVRGLITGHVYTDTNGNGKFDTGEPVFAGVTVEVLDENAGGAIIASTTTDANGFYQFRSLQAGDYKVVALTNQPGTVITTGQPADLANFTEQSTDTVDFGFFQPGTISGSKFLDLNRNGVRDTGEPGLSGFTIYIDQNNDGKFEAGEPFVVTASDGSFSFTNLGPDVINGVANPNGGPFHLREIQQPGYVATVPLAGQSLTETLTSGQVVTDANFGNFHPTGGGGATPPTPVLVAAEDAGGQPLVTMRNLATGAVALSFDAYNPGFLGGVRVATGFFQGGTIPDIVTAPGPGGGPHIRVFSGTTGKVIAEFMAYNPGFTGGLYVATGDINADGVPDIITGADAGGGPHVKVFDGAALLKGVIKVDESFFAYSPLFTGGVRVASADVNRDGYDDIVTGAGPGGGPQIQVFSGKVLSGATTGPAVIRSFFAYDSRFTGGVYVAAADINGDGFGDIVTGPGFGGGPHLRVFDGSGFGSLISQGFAFPVTSGGQLSSSSGWSSGLRVATTDINQDGHPDIIVGPGPGKPPTVRILDGRTLAILLPSTNVFDPTFLGGIFVGGD